MKQKISPVLAIVAIAVIVVLVGIVCYVRMSRGGYSAADMPQDVKDQLKNMKPVMPPTRNPSMTMPMSPQPPMHK